MKKLTCSTLIVSCLLAACGKEPADLCQAICDREQSCDGNSATCDPNCAEFQPRLLPDVRDQMAACFESLACNAPSDDVCISQALQATPVRTLDQAFQEECLEESNTCEFSDDICTISRLFAQEHVEAALQCLSRSSCDQIDDCLGDTLAR